MHNLTIQFIIKDCTYYSCLFGFPCLYYFVPTKLPNAKRIFVQFTPQNLQIC